MEFARQPSSLTFPKLLGALGKFLNRQTLEKLFLDFVDLEQTTLPLAFDLICLLLQQGEGRFETNYAGFNDLY